MDRCKSVYSAGLLLFAFFMQWRLMHAADEEHGSQALQSGGNRNPTVFLVGDSTVRNGTPGQRGWGEQLPSFFDPQRINVENRAIGGRGSRTFITEGRWGKVLKS